MLHRQDIRKVGRAGYIRHSLHMNQEEEGGFNLAKKKASKGVGWFCKPHLHQVERRSDHIFGKENL